MRLPRFFAPLSLAAVVLSTALTAHADTIMNELAEIFPNSSGNGTQVILRRDGLWMFGEEHVVPLSNIYKRGAISQASYDAFAIKITRPHDRENPNEFGTHMRKFGGGDKLWVTSVEVKNNSVQLALSSDRINNVRYIATLKFVFPDKTLPGMAALMSTVDEVLEVVPPSAEPADLASSSQPVPRTTRNTGVSVATPDSGPAANTATSSSVDPATMDLIGLRLGMTEAEVSAILEKRAVTPVERVRGSGDPLGDALEGRGCRARFCTKTIPNRLTPGKTHAQRTTLNTDQLSVEVEFTEVYPYSPSRPESCTSIKYVPNLQSDADKASFKQRVVSKYGPSAITFGDNSLTWCKRVSSDGYRCMFPSLNYFQALAGGPQLTLSAGDELWTEEQKLWNSQKHTEQPPL